MAARARISVLVDIAAVGLAATFLLWLGQNRFVAADEGFYLMAARLAMSGQLPYIDFFYPQMPLLPYLYGAWMEISGYTWTQARILASVFSLISAAAIYFIVRRLASQALAIFALSLFVLSGLTIGWFTTAKTYSASTALCLLSFIFLHQKISGPGLFAAFLGGVFLGLTVNVRLFYVSLIPLFVIWLFFQDGTAKEKIARVIFFLSGGAVTAAPHLYYLLYDFSSYWFNNYEYHTLRAEMSDAEVRAHRVSVLQIIFGLRDGRRFDGLQFALLSLAAVMHTVLRLSQKKMPDAAFFIGFFLLLVSLTPVPVHLQYLSVVTPFFIICASLLLREVARDFREKSSFLLVSFFTCFGLFCFFYFEPVPASIDRHINTGQGVHGVRGGQTEASRIETSSRIAALVNELTSPGEFVLSQWPGYLLESHALPYPGTENQFWIRVGHRITEKERAHYRVADMNSFRSALKDPALSVVVIRDVQMRRYFPRNILAEHDFYLKADIAGIFLYVRNRQ